MTTPWRRAGRAGLVLLLLVAAPAPGAAQGRLRPAPFVTCDRNHLTSFTGLLLTLERGRRETTLTIATDEATTERFTVRHPQGDGSSAFWIDGRSFTTSDWQALLPKGRLRADARATVWVCDDAPNPWVAIESPRP